ncbi:MAG: NAD(P)/FAD-dependent oxidoreductase [Myxococcota bacterium]
MSEAVPSQKTATGERALRIAVIGAGASGILSGIKLREAGIADVVIYEKADRPGGTWRENHYPGLSCDVPSHVYRYSFEPNPDWSRLFSPGHEIQNYLEAMVRKYGLDEVIRYGREVVRCEWDGARWEVELSDGEVDHADVVIAATGVLHHPRTPEIEGLERFEGACFHSARWDDSTVLDGKRVGIIGNGSTGVQITTAVSGRASHLSLFQRTAQWVLPQENPVYSEEEKARFRDDRELCQHLYRELNKSFITNFSHAVVDAESEGIAMVETACRAHLDEKVADPELKAKLTPDYRAGCKRLVVAGGFYEALQRSDTELVTEDIESVEATGVRTRDGRLHPLDVLVLATGFQTHQFIRPTKVIGRDGIRLDDAWAESNRTYLSVSVPQFPNFFMLVGPYSPVGNFSLIGVAETQLSYVMQLIEVLRDGRARQVAARADATERFFAEMVEATKGTIWASGCKSWYIDKSGVPASWPWDYDRFESMMATPDLKDFELL